MEAGGQVVGKVAAVYAGLLVVVHDAQLARLKADAGEGHVPGPQGSQSLEHLFDIVLVLFGAVGQAGEQAGFGEVGQDQVGLGAHSGHLGGEVGAEGGVELTVVRHHRVHHNEAALPAKGVEEGANVVDLLGGGQIAGVDGVKAQFTLLPVGGNGGDLEFLESGRESRYPHRKPRKWYSKSYYASVMALKEKMGEMYAEEFCGIIVRGLR